MAKKRRTFRKDIQRKLTLFGILPMLLIGIAAGVLINQSEKSLIQSEHTRLLRTMERLGSDYYRQVHLFFNIVYNEISQGDMRAIQNGFAFSRDLYSVIVLDANGTILQTYCRYSCSPGTIRLDPPQENLYRQYQPQAVLHRGAVYYSQAHERTLLTHIYAVKDRYYLITMDAQPFLDQIHYYLQRSDRSISIIDRQGNYIYDTQDPTLAAHQKNFTREGAYAYAVADKDPYTVVEFPAHYRPGDPVYRGWLDTDEFLSYAHVSDFGWIVVVRDHADALDAYLKKIFFAALILLIGTIALTYLGANVMAKHITVPVEHLIRDINALEHNRDSRESIRIEATYPIFETLIRSFDAMRKQIVAREEKLRTQIKENARIQRQMIQQEKLAAMGEMIGNIAHQWRQPLSVISTLATGLKTEQEIGIATPERIEEVTTQINDNVQYLSGTIDDFRDFIKGDHEKVAFEAREMIHSLTNLVFRQLARKEITVHLDTDESLMLYGYRNELLQVMINLLHNAADALVENRTDARMIWITMTEQETQTLIRVRDNGGGIDPAILGQIFDPYFTTKHKAQGTGLGLHMVHRMIQEGMQGSIHARTVEFVYESVTYTGAEFEIQIPQKGAS